MAVSAGIFYTQNLLTSYNSMMSRVSKIIPSNPEFLDYMRGRHMETEHPPDYTFLASDGNT